MTSWYRLIMSDENGVADPFYPSEEDFFEIEPDQLLTGKKIANWNTDAYVRSNCLKHDGNLDDVIFLTRKMIPAFSPRLQLALWETNLGAKDIQYLPIRIFQSTGEEAEGFAMVNVLNCVPGLDRENCFMLSENADEIDSATGQPRIICIGKPAVRESALAKYDVVRLSEYPYEFLISDRFRKVFRKGRFTGAILSGPLPSRE